MAAFAESWRRELRDPPFMSYLPYLQTRPLTIHEISKRLGSESVSTPLACNVRTSVSGPVSVAEASCSAASRP
jgi:hypothetical protein